MSSYGLWLSAAGMQVQDHRQTVLANNMANAHTTGFKMDLPIVFSRDVASEAAQGMPFANPVLDGMGGGLKVQQPHTVLGQGPIERTGRPLDVAIEGDGFFMVQGESGVRYTRSGEFAMNKAGELVLTAGEGRWRVLSTDNRPIKLDEGAGEVRILGDGTVRQGRNSVAKIGLVTTDDKQALRHSGETLFELTGNAKTAPAPGNLVAESHELSNFDAMQGLATMIEATRAYQLNATLIQMQDQLTSEAIARVGRVA